MNARLRAAIHWLGRWRMGLVLFLLVAGFYWKLTLTRQFDWTRGPDLAEQVLPWFQVQAHEWHAHRVPLWDRYLWSGQPLLGQGQPGAAYPVNWILFWLPLSRGHISTTALQWYYIAIHLMAAAFCYWLCRDLGRSRTASLAGGLIFSLSGFLGNADWPQMMNGAVWVPLVFLFLLRAAKGARTMANAALSGMFLGMAFLSGHHQIPALTALAFGGVWIWFIFRTGRPQARLARAAAVSLVFAALTSALQTLPMIEYGKLARRWVGAAEPLLWNQPVPYSVHATFDLKAYSLFGIVFPDVRAHHDPYLGVVALALAGLAVAACWRDSRVRLLFALGLGALVYALGHNSVFQGFLYAVVPELDKVRSPSAAVLLFQFGAAALAAFGADQLPAAASSLWSRRVMLAALAFGIVTLAMAQAVLFANKLAFPPDDRVIVTGLVALLVAALVYACRHATLSHTQANVLLVMLLLFELGNGAQYSLADRSEKGPMTWLDRLHANDDIAAFLRRQPGFQRTEVPDDAFAPNWGAWHDVEMYGGFLASVTNNVPDSEYFSITGRRLWGVAYTIAPKPVPDAGPEVFAGQSGMKVYRRPEAFPRAWAVHELVQVPDRDAGNRLNVRDPASFHNKAYVLRQAPAVETCGAPDRVELLEHQADRVTIRADMACAGMVVLSDTFFPGWRAQVDGQPTEVYEVNGAMRGVWAARGAHVVTMRYRPASVYAGAAMTLLGIAGAVLLGVIGGRRSK